MNFILNTHFLSTRKNGVFSFLNMHFLCLFLSLTRLVFLFVTLTTCCLTSRQVNQNFEHLSREMAQLSDHVTRTQQEQAGPLGAGGVLLRLKNRAVKGPFGRGLEGFGVKKRKFYIKMLQVGAGWFCFLLAFKQSGAFSLVSAWMHISVYISLSWLTTDSEFSWRVRRWMLKCS